MRLGFSQIGLVSARFGSSFSEIGLVLVRLGLNKIELVSVRFGSVSVRLVQFL
jgi:hypothetical protein